MMKFKKRDAAVSKARILEKAKELFSKKGYSACSMDELANECGLNKAMIFYYYKSKQELYESVIIDILDEIYISVENENKNLKNPVEELESFVKTYASFACEHLYLPSLLLRELSDNGAKIPETLFSHMRKLYMLFEDILKRGEKIGYFSDVQPIIIYFMVIGTLNLMVTTKSLRVKASEMEGIDTCAECNIDKISEYILSKIKKMLKDEK